MSNSDPHSYRDMRGVLSFEYNGRSLFVKADATEVAKALADVRKASQLLIDVADRPVTLTQQCFFVFRLEGHSWTQIIGRDHLDAAGNPFAGIMPDLEKVQEELATHVNDDDAKLLSESLATSALFYSVADTAYGIKYTLFESGAVIERLEAGDRFDEDGSEHCVCDWYSRDSLPGPDDAYAAMKWVEALFERLDAFEPGIPFERLIGCMQHKAGDEVKVYTDDGIIANIHFVAL